MVRETKEILSLSSLEIGYSSGGKKNLLLPPLTASAHQGELIALIGKNGIGKSTLLRTIAGLQPTLGGEVSYNGRNIKEYSGKELAKHVGYISTEIVKVSKMRVYDLVSLGRFPYTNWFGRIDNANHEIIIDAIEKTGISGMTGRFIAELSDGERQKAMIARILAQDTGVMIMDEPTAFLDIGSKFEILHLMHILSQKSGKTIIFSTHDLNAALGQADKIWLILENRMLEGAPEDLMLDGSFDHLFVSPAVQFNPEHGTYSLKGEERGSMYIEGEGILMNWTIKAINRAGFSVSGEKTDPYLRIPSDKNKNWQLNGSRGTLEFGSLYDLVKRISEESSGAI